MRFFLLLILLIPALASAHNAAEKYRRRSGTNRPKILMLDFDAAEEFSQSRLNNGNQLDACGFEVVEKRLSGKESQTDLNQLFAGYSKEVPVFLTAFHGEAVTDKGRLFPKALSFVSGEERIDGMSFLEKIRQAAPGSPRYLDTCHAGVCSVLGNTDVGMAACHDQESVCIRGTEQTIPEREMIKVLCDSINSCEIFNGVRKKDDSGWEREPYDANLDGFIDGEELSKYFRDRHGNANVRGAHSALLTTKDKTELEKAQKDCEERKMKSEVKTRELIGYRRKTTLFEESGIVLSESTSVVDADFTHSSKHGEGFDQSLLLAGDEQRELAQKETSAYALREVELRTTPPSVRGRYEIKDSTALSGTPPASFLITFERAKVGEEYTISCLGGPEVPEVRQGKESQHPIFPKGYKIRCRKNAAKLQ